MTDFLSAIRSGVDSAQERERNFREILGVFESLRNQLLSFSEKKLDLRLISYEDDGNYFNENTDLYQDRMVKIVRLAPEISFQVASIFFSSNGYPCTIRFEDNEFTSFDKSGVEEDLKNLLSSARVGQIIYNSLKL
jgi:hypothetical protein